MKKFKKSYYNKNKGCYIDTTRNVEYYPKSYCEICGQRQYLTCHHYISQHSYKNAIESIKIKFPKTLTQDFINENQKNIHAMSELSRRCTFNVGRAILPKVWH